jgi:beta-lactam-binding protein with PASTA domain
MQKNPADRFQTADELVRVLHDYLAGRLQAVNNATALLPVTPTTKLGDKASSTTAMPRVSQGSGRSTRGHRTTATELARQQQEENEKKHRRHMAIGIAIGVVAAVVIAIGIFYLLSSSSGTKQVPNLVGLSQDDATAQINATNWFTAGDVKEEYSDSVAEGKVIDQDPAAGKSFSKGTQITLYVSKGAEPAADETVPDLSGMTASEAEAALAKYNLVSKAGDGVYSSDVEVGKVAQQDPAAGTSVKAGDTVTYQLSLGPETVDVPDVTGESESAATSDLKAAGFAVSSQTAESDSVDKGYVIKQSPTGSAEKGSTVTITISSGSSKVSVPDVVGKSESSASSALESAGFSVNVAYASSSSVSSGDVISSNPGSGSLAKKGSTVTITVSTGSSTSSPDNTNNTTDDNKSSDNSNEESNNGKSSSGT